jgi:hypothetical protein
VQTFRIAPQNPDPRGFDLAGDFGATTAYLSQAELMLPSDHPQIAQTQTARRKILDAVGARLRATPQPVPSPASRLLQLAEFLQTARRAQAIDRGDRLT